MPVLLPLFVAAVLATMGAVGGAVGGAGVGAPHGPGSTGESDAPASGDPIISMTVDNFGEPVSTLDPSHPAWGRLALAGGPQIVTLTVATNGEHFLGYAARLTAPDAPGAQENFVCADENHVIESKVTCQFEVPMAAGENHLDVVFQALNESEPTEAHGVVRAGALQSRAGLQVQQPDGRWINVPDGGNTEVRAALPGAVRYVVLNTGQIPFRVAGSCSETALHPDGVLVCPLRASRPGIALGGDYRIPVRIVDAGGGTDSFTIEVAISVTGAFRA